MWLHMGLYGHCRGVCTESWLWEKNPLLQQGNQTCVSSGPVWCSSNWATSPPHENGSRKYSKSSFLHRGKEEGVKTSVKTRPKTLWASSYLSKVDIHPVFATSFVCLFSFFYSWTGETLHVQPCSWHSWMHTLPHLKWRTRQMSGPSLSD